MANWTSVKLSDLMRQKTLRMDAKYWIQKALLKKRKKELEKKKAWAEIRCGKVGRKAHAIGYRVKLSNTFYPIIFKDK